MTTLSKRKFFPVYPLVSLKKDPIIDCFCNGVLLSLNQIIGTYSWNILIDQHCVLCRRGMFALVDFKMDMGSSGPSFLALQADIRFTCYNWIIKVHLDICHMEIMVGICAFITSHLPIFRSVLDNFS